MRAVERSKFGVLVALSATLSVLTAVQTTPHVDETAHLASGVLFWRTGDHFTYRVNPPLVRSIAALPHAGRFSFPLTGGVDRDPYRTEFIAGAELAEQRGRLIFADLLLSRLAVMPFGLMAIILTGIWGCQLAGRTTARLAMMMLAFNPMFLGWWGTITPDVPAASMGLLATYLCWLWLRSGCLRDAFSAGIALGFACLTKTVWMVLSPIWLCVIVILFASGKWSGRSAGRYFVQWFLVTVLGTAVLGGGYGFHGCSTRVAAVPLQSQFFNDARSFVVELVPAVSRLPVVLPVDFVIGMDVQKLDFEDGDVSYVGGEKRDRGVWWFYFYLWLVKMPVPLLCILAAGLCQRLAGSHRYWLSEHGLLLTLTTLVIVFLLCTQSGLSQHGRYSLLILPMVIVGLIPTMSLLSERWRLRRVVEIWTIATALFAAPSLTSYYNLPSGGSKNGHRLLLGSDTDWGQEYLLLERWKEERIPDETLWFLLHKSVRPENYDAQSRQIRHVKMESMDRIELPSGWYAVSVDVIHHFPRWSIVGEVFRARSPVHQIGNTIQIYYLPAPVNVAHNAAILRGSFPKIFAMNQE